MMDTTIRLGPADMARISTALDAVFTQTSWTAEKAVAKAGYMLSRSAGAFCKPGQKRRPVYPNPAYEQDKRRTPFLMYVLGQGSDKIAAVVGVQGSGDPRTIIARRGWAKASWKIAAGKALRRTASVHGALSGARRMASVKSRGGANPDMTIRNDTSYILTAYPGVVSHAARAGMTALVATFDKELARELKKSWA